jgi:hypothetical protein
MKRIDQIFKRFSLALQVLRHGVVPDPVAEDLHPLSAEELADIKAIFPRPKFFIFGHARSGTTLLARLIRVHPEVHCNWQGHFFSRRPYLSSLIASPEVRAALSARSNRWNQGKELAHLIPRVVGDFIMEREAQQEQKSIVGDKSPNSLENGQAVQRLQAWYPDARLLFIVRDGRDVALSHRFQSFIDFPEYLSGEDLQIRDHFARDSEPFFQGEQSLFTRNGLRKAAQNWVQNVQETNTLGQNLYGARYLSMRYEDLIREPERTMKEVWAFLGVESASLDLAEGIARSMDRNPDADWQRQQAEGLVESVEKGKAGTWQELFTAQDRRIYREVAGEVLRDWGYQV